MPDKVDRDAALAGVERVTPIELILDVVFVLAFSEITAYTVREQSWLAVFDAVLFLAMLWRGWIGFSWLTSIVDPESTTVRLAIFTAMGAFVVMALIIPALGRQSPVDHHSGWLRYEFVAAYLVIRVVHTFLGLRASRGDERLRATVIRTVVGGAIAAVLLIAGCLTSSVVAAHALWVLAVVADYVFTYVLGRFVWRLVAGRFAERHGLIVIIALGETILAAGAGAEDADLTAAPTLVLAVVGLVLLATLWGAYFDGTEIAAERALVSAPAGITQNTLARRAYSLAHFPLVVGILLVALGPKTAIAHPHEPFPSHIAGAFFGGLALFLLGHVGFEHITTRRTNVPRLAVGLLVLPLIAVAVVRPAWESLVLATAIMAVLVSAQRGLLTLRR